MLRTIKTVVNAIGVGLAVGSVVSLACIRFWSGPDPVLTEVAVWLAASVLYGLISLLFQLNWGPWKVLPLHCLLCLAVTLSVGTVLGYAATPMELARTIVPDFLIVYLAITVVSWGYCILTAQALTRRLERRNGPAA